MSGIPKVAEATPRKGRILTFDNAVCGFVFMLFTGVYTLTLCPQVFWWDSGELTANIAVLGIPHRPGFPIYVLLGKLFSLLPLWSFAFRVNLLSCIFASLSLAVLCKTFQDCARMLFPQMARRKEVPLVSSLAFLFVFGFTYSFWIQAVRAEVYSLNMLFFSLLLFLSIRYIEKGKPKHIYLLLFLLGLGLGNHHLSLLSTVPALLLLLLIFDRRYFLNLKRIPLYALFSVLGLSVYLYLPIRSLSDPALAWGKVGSISGSAGSVLALDNIRNLNFGFLSGAATRVSQLSSLFIDQLTLACFVISLLGLFLLFKHNRKILTFLLLLIAGNCAAVMFMATEFISTNPDLHGYLVFSVLALAFSWGLAILIVLDLIHRASLVIGRVLSMAFLAIALLPMFDHYPQTNLSHNRIAHHYGSSVISDLDSNSVLFADNVNLNFILRELQHAEGMRKDVTVIDRGLLGFDWYVEQERRQKGFLFAALPEDLAGESLFGALLEKCRDLGMPAYMEFTERDLERADYLVPRGYVFQVSEDAVGPLPESALLLQKKWEEDGPFDPRDKVFQKDWDAQRVFVLSFYRLGLFYESKGMISCALDKLSRVREVDSENEELILKMKQLKALERLSEAADSDSSFGHDRPSG
jgi:hypothetical protein